MGLTLREQALVYVAARVAAREFAPTTAKNARCALLRFAAATGDPPIEQLTRRHVDRWLASRRLAPGALRTELSTIRTFCRWALDRGLINEDPTRGTTGPLRLRTQPRAHNAGEIAALLDACPDDRARVIVLLMAQEALRRAEVAGLMWDNIDLHNAVMIVRGKGSHERVVPISDETREAIEAYTISTHPARAGLPLIRSYRDDRSPIGPVQVGRLVSEWSRAAGIRGRTPHGLRHAAIGDMLTNGADVRDVAAFAGHQHYSTTLDTYGRRFHTIDRLRRAAAGRRYGRVPLARAAGT